MRCTLAVLCVLAAPIAAQRPIDELRPGALLIGGGGRMPKDVLDTFVRLAGGAKARIVYIPTASTRADEDGYRPTLLDKHEVASIQVLHTRDREVADSAEFVAPLTKATGVWFGGGQQSRLRAAYVGTKTEAAIHGVLARGGIVGGSSAGAAIQTRVMIESGRREPKLAEGLDLLPGCIVDQHFVARKRLPRLIAAVTKYPDRVGLGIDEKTALLVRGRRLSVLGSSTVTVVLAKSAHRPVHTRAVRTRLRGLQPGVHLDLVALRRAARLRASGRDHAHAPSRPRVPNGTLVIAGGSELPDVIWQRFVEAAGGKDARIVVVPTATGSAERGKPIADRLRKLGAKSVTVRHATDKATIESDEFLAPLREATGIWFVGGRQWRLVDAYEGTKALPLFHAVLARGGVVGGTSAGASIQGEYMVRGNPLGNRAIASEGYERGFGFLPSSAIDQHFSQRNRMDDLKSLMTSYPKLLGIGIDEGTAIVVRERRFDVIGTGKAFVCERGRWSEIAAGEDYAFGRK